MAAQIYAVNTCSFKDAELAVAQRASNFQVDLREPLMLPWRSNSPRAIATPRP